MTISMVSIGRLERLGSTGSDLTGVLGDVGEGFRSKVLENDTVRDLRRVRELEGGGLVG